jgi:hypothetical protein
MRELADHFPALANVDAIVIADIGASRKSGCAVFWARDMAADDFTEILQSVITALPRWSPPGRSPR